MYYYVLETAENDVKYIKTKSVWRSKEQAARETGFSIKWIAPCSLGIYLSIKIKKLFKKLLTNK